MLLCDTIAARQAARDPRRASHCLVLHGLGDTREGWKPVAPMIGLDATGFSFAQAPDEYHGGWSWFRLDEEMRPDDDGVRRSIALVDELVDGLLARLELPAERLFLMGFSQGCLMAVATALRSRHRFAGVVGISGFHTLLDEYPAGFGPQAREQDLLLTHGRFDGLIPVQLARMQATHLRSLGLRVDWREYDKDHGIDPERELPEIAAWMRQRGAR